MLSNSILNFVACESEGGAFSFSYVKELHIKGFKIRAIMYRYLFFAHRRLKKTAWSDYYFEMRGYFQNWFKELNSTIFKALHDLILDDQMKKHVPLGVTNTCWTNGKTRIHQMH